MWPNEGVNPLENFIFNPYTVVVDIIYNPQTKFLKWQKTGCTVKMVRYVCGQALASIKIWTGKDISIQIVNTKNIHFVD